jgi:hypothetical protein
MILLDSSGSMGKVRAPSVSDKFALTFWTFQPAKKDGDNVAVEIDIEVTFRPSD